MGKSKKDGHATWGTKPTKISGSAASWTLVQDKN